jgi:hypothetical protein
MRALPVDWSRLVTIYDDLRKDYGRWCEQNRIYWLNSCVYAFEFAAAFRNYLGAPDHFRDEGTKHPYVEACKVVADQDTDKQHFESTELYDLLTRGDDGAFTFGVTVVMEIEPNAFPKEPFGFTIGMLPRDDKCTMTIAGRRFEIDMSDDQARHPAYQHMVTILQKWLRSKPWNVERSESNIGFVQFGADHS